MPTGYTAVIGEKPTVTFAEFAIGCARAFGATIDMREEPLDKPIPESFPVSAYHSERKAQAQLELAKWEAMSPEQAASAADAAHAEEVESHAKRIKKAGKLRARYEAILAETQKWVPPSSEHGNFKDFMVEQLTSSIKFDCDTSYDKAPEKQTAAEWLGERIKGARRDIAYHAKEHAEEVTRTASRNEWIAKLRTSLTTH